MLKTKMQKKKDVKNKICPAIGPQTNQALELSGQERIFLTHCRKDKLFKSIEVMLNKIAPDHILQQ